MRKHGKGTEKVNSPWAPCVSSPRGRPGGPVVTGFVRASSCRAVWMWRGVVWLCAVLSRSCAGWGSAPRLCLVEGGKGGWKSVYPMGGFVPCLPHGWVCGALGVGRVAQHPTGCQNRRAQTYPIAVGVGLGVFRVLQGSHGSPTSPPAELTEPPRPPRSPGRPPSMGTLPLSRCSPHRAVLTYPKTGCHEEPCWHCHSSCPRCLHAVTHRGQHLLPHVASVQSSIPQPHRWGAPSPPHRAKTWHARRWGPQ